MTVSQGQITPEDRANSIHLKADELNKLIAEACVRHPDIKVTVTVNDEVRSAVMVNGIPSVSVEVVVIL